MKKIYLIRHSETEANARGQFRGRIDFALSGRGLQQCQQLADFFSKINVQQIFSSPLKRAMLTAEIAFKDQHVVADELINNLDLGKWAGLLKSEVKQQQPQLFAVWLSDPEELNFPGGEKFSDAEQRVNRFIQKIKDSEAETLAVVSHRSILKILLALVLELKKPYFWKIHLDNASVTTLLFSYERGFVLYQSNFTGHLSGFVSEWD